MAYLSKDEVKVRREKIKKLFPVKKGWKFSITRDHFSGIKLAILQAPTNFLKDTEQGYLSINECYIDENFPKEQAKVLNQMYAVLNQGNYNNSDPMTDYFNVGFYVSMSIGKWNQNFVYVEK
ncbi:MAG: hypothetical protein KGV57_01400 [Fusobacterium sp.]|nr:hypothetical protein [Fusobacterium sp.]